MQGADRRHRLLDAARGGTVPQSRLGLLGWAHRLIETAFLSWAGGLAGLFELLHGGCLRLLYFLGPLSGALLFEP